jgi:hypothetical protein
VTVECWAKGRGRDRPRGRLAGSMPSLAGLAVLEAAWTAARARSCGEACSAGGRMAGSRPGRIWGLVARQAAGRGGRVTAADVCAAAVAAVEVSGAWLSAATGAEAGHLMQVTDDVSERLAELQLTLGEGPCTDACASGGPVLASDLGERDAAGRWPVFAPAARQAGADAIFAFPLRIGAIRAGVMGLYRTRPGPLSAAQLGDALIFADTAILLLLDSQGHAADRAPAGSGPGGQPLDLTVHRAEIDQATGMLTEQLGVGIAEAFVRLRAYAYAHDRRLADVARAIVARRLRLHPDPAQPRTARRERLRQVPQPPPVRPGPGLHRRLRTRHRPDRGQAAEAAWRRAGGPPAPAGLGAQAIDLSRTRPVPPAAGSDGTAPPRAHPLDRKRLALFPSAGRRSPSARGEA